MSEIFPTLPAYDHEAWATDVRLCSRPDFQKMLDTWLPFAYFEILLDPTKRSIQDYNELLRRFAVSLHPKNEWQRGDFFREYSREGGIGNLYFPDKFYLSHAKAFCFDPNVDQNYSSFTGIMIRDHTDSRSNTYGVLRTALEFAKWLKLEKVPHKVFLRKKDAEDNVEVMLD